MSSTAVQTAFQTLQTDLNNDIPSRSQPTHASVGALEDTLDAIRKGTLSGTAAQTQIQSDQAAILSSMGLTQAQITQIQTDQTALQTAIYVGRRLRRRPVRRRRHRRQRPAPTPSTSRARLSRRPDRHANARRRTSKTTRPAELKPTHASIGAVQDDLDAIRKGTLTGTAAVTQVQTDTAAVLSSMGLTAAQITQIQTDQQAVQTAMQANSSSSRRRSTSTSTSSTSSTATIAATESTLQSVSAYLIGIPGVSCYRHARHGRRWLRWWLRRRYSSGGFGGGFGAGPRGGF